MRPHSNNSGGQDRNVSPPRHFHLSRSYYIQSEGGSWSEITMSMSSIDAPILEFLQQIFFWYTLCLNCTIKIFVLCNEKSCIFITCFTCMLTSCWKCSSQQGFYFLLALHFFHSKWITSHICQLLVYSLNWTISFCRLSVCQTIFADPSIFA